MDAQSRQRILEDDDALLAFAQGVTELVYPPVVRASTYRVIRAYQDLYSIFDFGDDPRRPVLMRGALHRVRRLKPKNPYANRIAERYVRRFKIDVRDHSLAMLISKRMYRRLLAKGIRAPKDDQFFAVSIIMLAEQTRAPARPVRLKTRNVSHRIALQAIMELGLIEPGDLK